MESVKCVAQAIELGVRRLLLEAETGVDYVSVGALTHSAKALDISLIVEPKALTGNRNEIRITTCLTDHTLRATHPPIFLGILTNRVGFGKVNSTYEGSAREPRRNEGPFQNAGR